MKFYFFFFLIFGISQFVLSQNVSFTLQDFYKENHHLDAKVDSIFNKLSDKERVAQMIISCAGELGKSNATIEKLTKENVIGGVIFLKGQKKDFTKAIKKLNGISEVSNSIPLLFSMDAEPTLLPSRLKSSMKLKKTKDIKTFEASDSVVSKINKELLEIGIHQNFAPVLDISTSNAAITSRSYGSNLDSVISLANRFIKKTQEGGIIATAKHFPGHGLVQGDTHKQQVFIDGPLREVENYIPVIDNEVLSIMIAHIVVKNNQAFNTDGLPSSCSRRIVTDLLKDGMCFNGIVISDALNIMKAVTIIENASLLASKAGCDMILMPKDERKTMRLVLNELKVNDVYKAQIYTSIKKILRLKVCAGIL